MFHPLARTALAATLGLALAGCVVVMPVGPVVVGQVYPSHADPGPAPASANCPRPARAAASASEVLSQVNSERRAKGLTTLRASARLTRVAQAHACDNAARRGISHTGSDGSDLGQRLRREGYQLATAAENTGLGFDSPTRVMALW
ncbi:MAG TPA: CAP domain-containing protein, partial [Paracoccaceae bacterium]